MTNFISAQGLGSLFQAGQGLQNPFAQNDRSANPLFNRNNSLQNNLQQLNSPLQNAGNPNRLQDSAANRLLQPAERQQQEEEEGEEDRVELSDFTEEAARKALEQANRSPQQNGGANQIFVSQDGRYEASIDLRYDASGAYELNMAVRFAQSSSMAAQTAQNLVGAGEETAPAQANGGGSRGAEVYAERYTSFEQVLQTRDFEAQIFFEQAQSVGARAEQRTGEGVGQQVNSVAQNLAEQYTLNISISGSDLENFNQNVEQLSQFDDTGTLTGFLDAAQNVLNANSSNVGSLFDATQSLLSASQEHVGAKLNNFFTNMNESYGEELASLGFGEDFFNNLGNDVQNDLNKFFQVTNDMFANATGNNGAIEDDPNAARRNQVDVLEESLNRMREQREEEDKETQSANREMLETLMPKLGDTLTPEEKPSAANLDKMA